MSGEAGASLESELYALFVGTGLIVSVAMRPGGNGSEVGEYFERQSAPFRRWLERAKPALDALFVQLVAEGLPIVARDQPHETLWGTFIEDGDERNFRKHHKGGPLAVQLDGSARMPDHRSLTLMFLVSGRVEKSRFDPVIERIVAILRETHAEPAPPTPATPEPRHVPAPVRRSWWARLFSKG